MNFLQVGESPPREAEESKYAEFFEFIYNIEPGTGQGIVVPKGEAKKYQVAALSISCDSKYESYRNYRMRDRRVETRKTRVDGGVRLDIYVSEV